jgi:hypothetical protein
METMMFRKIAFTIIAAASLSFAALAPAAAGHGGSGGHGGHGGSGMHMGGHSGNHGGHFGHGRYWGRSAFFVGRSCYKTVWTNSGPRRVYICGGAAF